MQLDVSSTVIRAGPRPTGQPQSTIANGQSSHRSFFPLLLFADTRLTDTSIDVGSNISMLHLRLRKQIAQ